MEFYVYYSCENDRETGQTKLSLADFDTKSIRDIKYAIQDAIQAPFCDQRLFYQGQPLANDSLQLNRLYFREGDSFNVEFLAVADIPGISELLDVLKMASHEIVEILHRELPSIEDHSSGLWRFYDRLVYAVEGLATFFFPWKSLRSVAQRHYFVQEGGFDAFLEVFKFSQQLYSIGCPGDVGSCNLIDDAVIIQQLKHHFNQGQLVLQLCCLSFLWNFAETPEDRKFVLSRGVLPLTIDALLLHPQPLEDSDSHDLASTVVGVNETAIGCCGGLVESDSATQEQVSKMTPLVDKILFMIDRSQSEPANYSLFSSQVASNTLFYCTFNANSAQSLLDCGALAKMINITRELLVDKDGNTPLRYYCCLFLARMRSAPLIKLDRDTCVVIDGLIDMFLNLHVPSEISKWEEETSFVWMTMVPLVHLAFAEGNTSCSHGNMNGGNLGNYGYGYQNNDLSHNPLQNEGDCLGNEWSASAEWYKQASQMAVSDKVETIWETCEDATNIVSARESSSSGDMKESANCDSSLSCDELAQHIKKCKELEDRLVAQNSEKDTDAVNIAASSDTPVPECQSCTMACPRTNFVWPGSKSTQKLGIFSLVHMLSIKENQKLALSENLVEYLVCLSWQLNSSGKEKILASLSNFNLASPPSLKVAAKSVLARVNGLDMVYNS